MTYRRPSFASSPPPRRSAAHSSPSRFGRGGTRSSCASRARPRRDPSSRSFARDLYKLRRMARPSHVRNAVREVIADSSRHDWSIDDLTAELAAREVAADFSSVFRALAFLEAEGAVSRVELGDGKARFEPTHGHHEHVRCESCGAVAAVPGCPVETARSQVERATGFAITGHRLLFSGLCGDCREAGA